jgi:hypothetical protein
MALPLVTMLVLNLERLLDGKKVKLLVVVLALRWALAVEHGLGVRSEFHLGFGLVRKWVHGKELKLAGM